MKRFTQVAGVERWSNESPTCDKSTIVSVEGRGEYADGAPEDLPVVVEVDVVRVFVYVDSRLIIL